LAWTQLSIAVIKELSTGEALPITCSVNSIRSWSDSSPSTCAIRRWTASSPRPGGTRQSIRTWARDGITLILVDALLIVGVSVTPNMGSTSVRRRGSAAPICSRAAPGSSGFSPSPRSNAAGASVTSKESG